MTCVVTARGLEGFSETEISAELDRVTEEKVSNNLGHWSKVQCVLETARVNGGKSLTTYLVSFIVYIEVLLHILTGRCEFKFHYIRIEDS